MLSTRNLSNAARMSATSGRMSAVRGDVQNVENDISTLRRDVASLRADATAAVAGTPLMAQREALTKMRMDKESLLRKEYERNLESKAALDQRIKNEAEDLRRMEYEKCNPPCPPKKPACPPACPPKVECPKPCPPPPCPEPCDPCEKPDPCDPCADPCKKNFMTRHYLWVYILVAIIVLVVIFWYGASKECKWKKMNCKGVEWACSSSGRAILAIFLIIAVLLFAWSCAAAAGGQRMNGCGKKANIMILVFVVVMILILIAFIQFFRGSVKSAYWLMIVVLIIAIIGTVLLAYWKLTGAAIAMGIFAIWALVMVWVFNRCSRQHCGRKDSSSSVSSSDVTSTTSA